MPKEIRDIRMIERIMTGAAADPPRWEITPEFRQAAVRRIMRILADPASTNREVTSAFRALVSAEAQNQSDEQHSDSMDQARSRVLDLLARARSTSGDRLTDGSGAG